jgi:predicted chitinase
VRDRRDLIAAMIDDAQLQKIMPALAVARRGLYLPHLNAAMRASGIGTTLLRTAAFVAQLAHESGEFRWMEEIWGPTPAQLRYEPPNDLAQRLGNTEPGDGQRFKGRGPIQITGRFNYAKYGTLLGRDLVAEPALAAAPELAFATAGLFWQTNGLNELADAEDFVKITRRINGGTNGLADREKYYAQAKTVLASGFVADPQSRGAPRSRSRSGSSPAADSLTRGYEAIARTERALKGAATRAAKRAPARRVKA